MAIQDKLFRFLSLQRYTLLDETVMNGAVEFSKRTEVPSVNSLEPLYYALDIPEGRRILIHTRTLELTEGVYDIDLVRYEGGYTGGTPALRTALFEKDPVSSTVQTNILTNVTPTGAGVVVAELPRIDTGTAQQGNSRAGGAAAEDTVLKSFFGNDVLIRVQKIGDPADFTASFGMVAWEKDK